MPTWVNRACRFMRMYWLRARAMWMCLHRKVLGSSISLGILKYYPLKGAKECDWLSMGIKLEFDSLRRYCTMVEFEVLLEYTRNLSQEILREIFEVSVTVY